MKVRINVDEQADESEIVIHAAKATANIERLQQQIENLVNDQQTIVGDLNGEVHYIPVSNVLFIETAERHLQVHTADEIYISKQRLYEMAADLPHEFLQISKSTIVNVSQVNALNKSLSNCLVSFQGSHKQVYASRRYYKDLQDLLTEMRSIS